MNRMTDREKDLANYAIITRQTENKTQQTLPSLFSLFFSIKPRSKYQ